MSYEPRSTPAADERAAVMHAWTSVRDDADGALAIVARHAIAGALRGSPCDDLRSDFALDAYANRLEAVSLFSEWTALREAELAR